MMVLTRISKKESFELQEGYTIDNYVGGVYIQIESEYNPEKPDYTPTNKTQYDLPENCNDYYEVDDSSLNLMLKGY